MRALHGLGEPLRGLHVVPRVGEHCTEAVVRPGLRTIASRLALADMRQSSLEAYRAPSAISASYSLPDSAARRIRDSAAAPHHHPPTPSAAPSPSCETPRAVPKRQGSPGRVDAAPVRRRHLYLPCVPYVRNLTLTLIPKSLTLGVRVQEDLTCETRCRRAPASRQRVIARKEETRVVPGLGRVCFYLSERKSRNQQV